MMKLKGKKWIAAVLSAMLVTGVIWEPMAGEVQVAEPSKAETTVEQAAPAKAESAQPETAPAAEEKATDAPAKQEETQAAQEETPAAQEETQAAQEETQAAQEETPAAQEETPAAQEGASEAANEVPEDSSEKSTESEDASEAASGEAGLEAVLNGKKKKEESAEEKAEEKADEKALPEDSELSITFGEDATGAYYAFAFAAGSTPVDITYSLTDGSGNTVGTPVTDPAVTGAFSVKKYILELTDNVFGLTMDDIGKTVKISVTVKPSSGSEPAKEAVSAESITITEPSMTMPSVIAYTAADTVGELMDVSKVSGIAFDTGSFRVDRTVEKKAGDSWTAVDSAKALTADDGGEYRILIQTVLKEYYSNEFTVVVPATGVEVTGEQQLGMKLTAKAVGPEEGGEPYPVAYEWFFGEAGKVLGSETTFTPQLKDAVEAQTLALCVRVTDGVGNKFTKVLKLAPLDLSKAEINAVGYTVLTYDGTSQVPTDAKIQLGDLVIPPSLYLTSAAAGKNTKNAGEGWMTVKGNSAYLTGSKDVPYQIEKEDQDIEKSDLKTSFTYTGSPQMPVLAEKIRSAGSLSYKNWRKKGADGKWHPIAGAPKDAGTYRVRVIVSPANGNFNPIVLKRVVFTIHPKSAPAKKETSSSARRSYGKYVPQPGGKDLTVTDAEGKSAGYALDTLLQGDALSQIAALTGGTDLSQVDPENLTQEQLAQLEQLENAEFILEVKAEPEKKEDGTELTDENGKPVYGERSLHISTSYAKNLESHGCSKVRFVLGDSAVQVTIASLMSGTAVAVRLAPVSTETLTDGELQALEPYGTDMPMYEVQTLRESSGADITDDLAKTGAIEVMLDITGSVVAAVSQQEILFLVENRAEEPDDVTATMIRSMSVSDKGKTYLKGTAPGGGVFCLPNAQ